VRSLIKAGFSIEPDHKKHTANFEHIENYFKDKYNVNIDSSAKDIFRLCFVSDDPDLYINSKPKRFIPVLQRKADNKTTAPAESSQDFLKTGIEKGSRHNHLITKASKLKQNYSV